MQVLLDVDNLDTPRLRLLLAALEAVPSAQVVAAGAAPALEAIDWPPWVRVLLAIGWQGADVLLARAYHADDQPLLLATGDGDFVQLARRHRARSCSSAGRRAARVRSPARGSPQPIRPPTPVPSYAPGSHSGPTMPVTRVCSA